MANIDLVQFVTGTVSAASSLNVLFSSAVTALNTIIVAIGQFAQGNTVSTVIDPVNNAGYTRRVYSTMSNASDTQAHIVVHDLIGLSSGRAASTYRISVNLSGSGGGLSVGASEWTGGLIFGSTASANGTSSGPQAGSQTASSTPLLFFCAAIHNTAGTLFNSTVGAGGPQTYLTTVDPTNANQAMNLIYSTNSSVTQNPMHSMNVSTRWLAASVLYTGAGGGGGATQSWPSQFMIMGMG